jgi:hypothetical protein
MLGEFAETLKKYHLGAEIETADPGAFTDTIIKNTV